MHLSEPELIKKGWIIVEQPSTLEQPAIEPLSLMDKAAGIFYEPLKVFESFKTHRVKISDWLVPVLLLAIIAAISAYVSSNSPAIRFQATQQVEQRLDKMVAEGKISAEQADRMKESIENTPSSGTPLAMVLASLGRIVVFFVAAAVWLLVGKLILKGDVNYSQMMGVAGVSSWIMIVGSILAVVLTAFLSRPGAGVNLGMLVPVAPLNKTYSLLRSADLFTIWNLAATSIGIGALSGRKGSSAFVWVFGVWVVVVLAMVFIFGGLIGG